MTSSDDLHKLIVSLTQAEKRYFKLYASRHVIGEENNYVKLFDAIHAQKVYNEDKLRTQFEGEKFIARLPFEKNYLFKLILKSLRAFHAEKSKSQEAEEMIGEAQLLNEKGLWERSLRLLGKAKEIAAKYDFFPLHMQALMLERVQIKMRVTKDPEKRLEENAREREMVMACMENESQLATLYDQLFHRIRREFMLRNAESRSALDAFMLHPLLTNEAEALSFTAKRSFYATHTFYHQLRGDYSKANEGYKNVVAHWEAHPHFMEEDVWNYRKALANFLASSTLVNDYAQFEPVLQKIKAEPFRHPEEEREAMSNYYYYRLVWQMNTAQLDAADAELNVWTGWMNENLSHLNKARELGFYMNAGILQLFLGKYREGLLWMNRIMDNDKLHHREDLQLMARLVQLILHFELGNHDLMEPLARSSARAMKSRDALHPFEKTLLHFLKNIAETAEKDRLPRWKELLTELQGMQLADKESRPQGLEEVTLWAESKVNGVPLKIWVSR